jgi:hypothetical protein
MFGLYITIPFFIKQIEEISLSFTDIYLEGMSIFLKKRLIFKDEEQKNIITQEINKIEGVLKLIKQDRRTLYLKRKATGIKIQEQLPSTEESKENDEALEKYFKELDEEIEKYIDD